MSVLETSGIGQSDTEILDHSDVSLYVMTPEFGAATQLEKIDMLDFADLVAINKFDKRGALDALRDVKKQYQRNHLMWDAQPEDMPVYGTIASQFNDPGMNRLYMAIMEVLKQKTNASLDSQFHVTMENSEKTYVITPTSTSYISQISENNRNYDSRAESQVEVAQNLYGIYRSLYSLTAAAKSDKEDSYLTQTGLDEALFLESITEDKDQSLATLLIEQFNRIKKDLDPHNWDILIQWEGKKALYKNPIYQFKVRDKEIRIPTHTTTLSQSEIPKVALPKYKAWGDLLRWVLQENVPGEFPFTSGLYPFKRTEEDPTRMFAGEGGPERTNR